MSKIACKIHVELRPGVVRKLTFVVADVSMPFVLGMQWPRSSNVRIDFIMVRMQLCNMNGKVQTGLMTEHQPKQFAMHSSTLNLLEVLPQLPD